VAQVYQEVQEVLIDPNARRGPNSLLREPKKRLMRERQLEALFSWWWKGIDMDRG
jgi:hypothetical protein